MSAWVKHKPVGNVTDSAYSKRETLPYYTLDAALGTYNVRPYRDHKGAFVCWDVTLNTFEPDAKGRHWTKVGIGLKVHDAQSEAEAHRDASAR